MTLKETSGEFRTNKNDDNFTMKLYLVSNSPYITYLLRYFAGIGYIPKIAQLV